MDMRLHQYGGRLIETDGRPTVEMVSGNDNARTRHQYRRTSDGGIERRSLTADGTPWLDTGASWETMGTHDVLALRTHRGQYHPILDPLGL